MIARNILFVVPVFVLAPLIVHAQWTLPNPSGCTLPDGQLGSCVDIRECSLLLNLLIAHKPRVPPNVIDYINRHQCGFMGFNQMVCCPSSSSTVEPPSPQPSPVTDTDRFTETVPTPTPSQIIHTVAPDVSQHLNLRFLPREECGTLNDYRIIGGNITSIFEYPWMALLGYNTKKGLQFNCGGTLVTKRFVLTAAHCVTNLKSSSLVSVRIGEHNLKSDKDCEMQFGVEVCAPPVQDFEIEKVIAHPFYNHTIVQNDVALIKLASDVDTSKENARTICLPVGNERNYNIDKRKMIVAGWGITENGYSSDVMLKVALPIVPNDKCAEYYVRSTPITATQICAGGVEGMDSCQGDSGGPLKIPTADSLTGDPRFFQYGIVSFGSRSCGRQGVPAVYTRVTFFMDWILDNLDQ